MHGSLNPILMVKVYDVYKREKFRVVDTIPCSAAYFPNFAFTSGVAFKYGELFCIMFSSLLASVNEVEEITLMRDP